MAVILHLIEEYHIKRLELTRKDDAHFGHFIRLSTYLARYPANVLTPSELRVLLFILGRTLVWKKRAENIAFRHFLEGVNQGNGQVCGPTGLAKQAVRDAIQGLQDKKYLDIHAFKTGNMENQWRFYEPQVDNLLADLMIYAPENTFTPLPVTGIPPSRSPGVINNSNKNNLSSYEDSASEPPTRKAVDHRERTSSMANRIAVDCSQDPNELVKQIAGRAQANRTTRATKNAGLVPKNKWTTLDLQALLDTARQEAELDGFRTPRVIVVAKNIGILHRRMKDAGMQEVMTFFIWTLKNWGTVASANQRAKARQTRDTKTTASAMSLAPNFNDLSFRFPYILALFNEREQIKENEGREQRQQQAKVAAHKVQSEAAIQARIAQTRIKDMAREEKRKEDEQDVQRRVRRTPRPLATDDIVIPEFKEKTWGSK